MLESRDNRPGTALVSPHAAEAVRRHGRLNCISAKRTTSIAHVTFVSASTSSEFEVSKGIRGRGIDSQKEAQVRKVGKTVFEERQSVPKKWATRSRSPNT